MQHFLRQHAHLAVVHIRPAIAIQILGPERQRNDGNIVDTDRVNPRKSHTGRHFVAVGVQFVINLDEGVTHGLPDLELDRDNALVAHGHGVDMLDSGNLAHDSLKWRNREIGNLSCRSARILDPEIDHGHGDLRVFLARNQQITHDAHHEHGDVEQRRERRIDEILGHAASEAEIGVVQFIQVVEIGGILLAHSTAILLMLKRRNSRCSAFLVIQYELPGFPGSAFNGSAVL